MSTKRYGQRDYMRKLVKQHGRNKTAVCAAYASAERDGIVARNSNSTRKTPEEYPLALWLDGEQKGWF